MNHAGTFRAASLLVLVSLTTSACSEVNLPTAASTRFPLQQRYSIRNDVKRHAKYFQYDDSGSNWAHDEDPITIGPDGNPWFGEIETGQVGRINHDGTITKFLVGTETSFPGAITTGADRNLWVVAAGYPAMVRVTPNGKMSFFSIPSGINQGDITVGSDRELWFAMPGAKSVGRVTLKGGFTQYSLGNDDSSGALTTGADGYV
jgi:streptogramin lyase